GRGFDGGPPGRGAAVAAVPPGPAGTAAAPLAAGRQIAGHGGVGHEQSNRGRAHEESGTGGPASSAALPARAAGATSSTGNPITCKRKGKDRVLSVLSATACATRAACAAQRGIVREGRVGDAQEAAVARDASS